MSLYPVEKRNHSPNREEKKKGHGFSVTPRTNMSVLLAKGEAHLADQRKKKLRTPVATGKKRARISKISRAID